MSTQEAVNRPETTQVRRYEPWATSPVHDDLLVALRDVAARDGGKRLVGEAFDLAEQRQAERHAREIQARDDDIAKDVLDACKKKTTAIGLLVGAGFVAGLITAAMLGWWL